MALTRLGIEARGTALGRSAAAPNGSRHRRPWIRSQVWRNVSPLGLGVSDKIDRAHAVGRPQSTRTAPIHAGPSRHAPPSRCWPIDLPPDNRDYVAVVTSQVVSAIQHFGASYYPRRTRGLPTREKHQINCALAVGAQPSTLPPAQLTEIRCVDETHRGRRHRPRNRRSAYRC